MIPLSSLKVCAIQVLAFLVEDLNVVISLLFYQDKSISGALVNAAERACSPK